MGFLLVVSLCTVLLEIKLILRQHTYIQKLIGARHELKEENARLRKKVEDVVITFD